MLDSICKWKINWRSYCEFTSIENLYKKQIAWQNSFAEKKSHSHLKQIKCFEKSCWKCNWNVLKSNNTHRGRVYRNYFHKILCTKLSTNVTNKIYILKWKRFTVKKKSVPLVTFLICITSKNIKTEKLYWKIKIVSTRCVQFLWERICFYKNCFL